MANLLLQNVNDYLTYPTIWHWTSKKNLSVNRNVAHVSDNINRNALYMTPIENKIEKNQVGKVWFRITCYMLLLYADLFAVV